MQSLASIHPGWSRLLARLARVGLVRGLDLGDAEWLLGAAADQAPTTHALAELLSSYYSAQGDTVEAMWRKQSDHVIALRSSAAEPAAVAAQLALALPDLGALSVTIEHHALELGSEGGKVSLSRVVRHARVPARSRRMPDLSPSAVVRGANVLLARRRHNLRFVPIAAPGSELIFVAVSERGARVLAQLALSPLSSEALQRFACFEPAPPRLAAG